MTIRIPEPQNRPRLNGPPNGWAESALVVGKIDERLAPDIKVSTSANPYLDLGSHRGYATLTNAVRAARRATAGAEEGAAFVHQADERFFLQQATRPLDGIGNHTSFRIQDFRPDRFRFMTDRVLAVVDDEVVLFNPRPPA